MQYERDAHPKAGEAKPCIPATEKSCALSPGSQSDFWVPTKMCIYQLIAFPIALEVLSVE